MLVLLGAVGAGVIGAVVLPPVWRERRRAALRRTPLPDAWQQILRRRVPAYGRLPPALRQQLHGIIQVLLAEKQFVGCAGLEVTEAMRVTIAAQAGLLLLNRDTGYYPGLSSILVYPQAFFVRHESRDDAGVHSLRERVLSG
jgi:Mlc titration factor MtfA (ptsG expression regulator)